MTVQSYDGAEGRGLMTGSQSSITLFNKWFWIIEEMFGRMTLRDEGKRCCLSNDKKGKSLQPLTGQRKQVKKNLP